MEPNFCNYAEHFFVGLNLTCTDILSRSLKMCSFRCADLFKTEESVCLGEGIKGIREKENQPIVKGWHDHHYRCMMANYNLFFTICICSVDRISKHKRSAASLMTVFLFITKAATTQSQTCQFSTAAFSPRQLATTHACYKWVLLSLQSCLNDSIK